MSVKDYTAERELEHFAERSWLLFFNNHLYANNLISEKEYKRMVEKIAQRCAVQSRIKSPR